MKANAVDGARRVRARDRTGRAVPAPEANAEIQANLDVSQTSFVLLFLYWSTKRVMLGKISIEPLTKPNFSSKVHDGCQTRLNISLFICMHVLYW